MFYTVKDVAKRTKLSVHTIRYYAKEGLIPNIERSERGIRMFKESDLEWFFLIDCMKKTGMSIKDIKAFSDLYKQGDSTIDQRLDMFIQRRRDLEKQIDEMQEILDIVKYKLWYYQTAKEAGTTAIHNTIKEEDIPEVIRAIMKKRRY